MEGEALLLFRRIFWRLGGYWGKREISGLLERVEKVSFGLYIPHIALLRAFWVEEGAETGHIGGRMEEGGEFLGWVAGEKD